VSSNSPTPYRPEASYVFGVALGEDRFVTGNYTARPVEWTLQRLHCFRCRCR